MVEGVSDRPVKCFGPCLKFFAVTRAAGDALFRYPIGAHLPPFVVVPGQPRLSNVFIPLVLGNFSGVDVAVVVDHRHLFCMVVEQILSCLIGQQEISVHKRLFHCGKTSLSKQTF